MGNKLFHAALSEEELTEAQLGDFIVLPPECLYEILSYCDHRDLIALSCVNHLFHEVASDNQRWQQFYIHEFGFPHQLSNHSKEELLELPWMEMFQKKSTKRFHPTPAGPPPALPRHWSLRILGFFVCLILQVILLPLIFLMLLLLLVTLSHRSVLVLRQLYDAFKKGTLCETSTLTDAFFFRGPAYDPSSVSNPWLHIYRQVAGQFFSALVDIVWIMLPYLSFWATVLTVYRLPLLVRQLWETPRKDNDINAGFAVMTQGWYLVIDLVTFFTLTPILLITIHRVPSTWRRLRGLPYSEWKETKQAGILYDEFKRICQFSTGAFARTSSLSGETLDEEAAAESWEPKEEVGSSSSTVTTTTATSCAEGIKAVVSWIYTAIGFVCLVLLGLPSALIVLGTLTHNSVLLVKNLKAKKALGTGTCWTYLGCILQHLFFLLLWDLLLFATLPILSSWIVLLTVYRLPVAYKKVTNPQDSNKTVGVDMSVIMLGQGWYLIVDLLAFIFVFLPILFTCHRLGPLVTRFQESASYTEGVEKWTTFLCEEFKRICTCSTNDDVEGGGGGSTTFLCTKLCSLLGKGLVLLVLLPLSLFGCLLTMVTFSHRTLLLIRFFTLNKDWSPERVGWILFMSGVWVMWDILWVLLPFFSWFAIVVTVYRLPFLVKKLWKEANPQKWDVHEKSRDLTFFMIGQMVQVFCDVLVVILLLIPLAVTVHRLPTLWRRIGEEGYAGLVGENKIPSVLWAEFKKIGYCEPSEKEKLITNIVNE